MTVTNVTPPVVSGTARVGQTLVTTQGTWTFDLDYLTYAYAWLRCDAMGASCSAIGGETGIQYVIQSADIGSTLRSEVTATEHTPPGGNTTPVSPGGMVAAINAAAPGDTLEATGGSHPSFTLPRTFPTNNRLNIITQGGSYFVGIDTAGQDGYAIHDATFTRPLSSDIDDAAIYLHGPSTGISIIDCTITGGTYCIKGYCPESQGYLDDILIQGCDISASKEDILNMNGIRNSTFDSNNIHDPVFTAGAHQDLIQFTGSPGDARNINITISSNHFYGTTTSGGNSQCIQTGKLLDSLIVNNLFDHWTGGKGLNLDHGSQRVKVVNNTFQNLPSGQSTPSISLNNGTGTTTQIEIWNNIVQGIYVPTTSMLGICSTNWYTENSACGWELERSGCQLPAGEPGKPALCQYDGL